MIEGLGQNMRQSKGLERIPSATTPNAQKPSHWHQRIHRTDPSKLPSALARLMAGQWKKGAIPPFWDGKTAERIVVQVEHVLIELELLVCVGQDMRLLSLGSLVMAPYRLSL